MFIIEIAGSIFFKRLFGSCSEVLCCIQIYLCRLSICYIEETKRHLPTRIKEHLQTDTKSHILQHLNENPNCRDLCDDSCFIIIDHASSSFRLKLKEVLHITWLKPLLNKQKNNVSIIISDISDYSILGFLLPLFYYCYSVHYSDTILFYRH